MTDDQKARLEKAAEDYFGEDGPGYLGMQIFYAGAAWMRDDMEANAKASSEETSPREWWICQGKAYDKPLITTMTDEVHVIEKSAFEKLKADEAKRVAGLIDALEKYRGVKAWVSTPTNYGQDLRHSQELVADDALAQFEEMKAGK